MSDFPFTEKKISKNKYIRRFSSEVNESEMVWHRDREDRLVKIVESKGWKIQFDNKVPVEMKEGDCFFIEAYSWHRVIKGGGALVVEITKHSRTI